MCELFLFVLQTNEIILLRNLIHWKFQQIPYFLSVPNYTHLYRTHTHSLSLFQWHRFSTRRLCSAPSAKASVPRFSLGYSRNLNTSYSRQLAILWALHVLLFHYLCYVILEGSHKTDFKFLKFVYSWEKKLKN